MKLTRSMPTVWVQFSEWNPCKKWEKFYYLPLAAAFVFGASAAFWTGIFFYPLPLSVLLSFLCGIEAVLLVWMKTWADSSFRHPQETDSLSGDDSIRKSATIKFAKIVLVRWNVVTLPFSIMWYLWKRILRLIRPIFYTA